jgi:hypothetical protein
MQERVVHLRADQLDRRKAVQYQSRVFQHSAEEMATGSVLRRWFRLPPTNWKKHSCVVSVASWNRLAWRGVAAMRRRCNRSCVARKKSDAMIPVRADQERNTRSATERRGVILSCYPVGAAFCAEGSMDLACNGNGLQEMHRFFAAKNAVQDDKLVLDDERDLRLLIALNIISCAGFCDSCFHSANSVA